MLTAILQRANNLLKQFLQKTVARINHEAVIKDIAHEVDISAGYFLTLTMANLIALSGLITNSSPVIIGAMLISPLMGPILSLGFAFISGDTKIWRRSVKKISIVLQDFASLGDNFHFFLDKLLTQWQSPVSSEIGFLFACFPPLEKSTNVHHWPQSTVACLGSRVSVFAMWSS
jgi:hypothetical protein